MRKTLAILSVLAAVLLYCNGVLAQEITSLSKEDIQLIREHKPSADVKPQKVSHFNAPARQGNLVQYVFALGTYFYQHQVAPAIGRGCRYEPNCPEYGRQLVEEQGLPLGVICAADRVMRCNRIAMADKHIRLLVNPKDGRIHETTQRYLLK